MFLSIFINDFAFFNNYFDYFLSIFINDFAFFNNYFDYFLSIFLNKHFNKKFLIY